MTRGIGRGKPTGFRESLVDRLCEGTHPVEASLRSDKTVELFQESIERNYLHIKFTNTKGGTELSKGDSSVEKLLGFPLPHANL